jgi:hypothetical protein
VGFGVAAAVVAGAGCYCSLHSSDDQGLSGSCRTVEVVELTPDKISALRVRCHIVVYSHRVTPERRSELIQPSQAKLTSNLPSELDLAGYQRVI